MKKKFAKKIKITVTDPWDSKEIIIGFFDRPILVDNLVSLLIHSETGQWIALLPRYKGQKLMNEMKKTREFVVNIAKLRDVESNAERVTSDHVVSYASGSAEIIE